MPNETSTDGRWPGSEPSPMYSPPVVVDPDIEHYWFDVNLACLRRLFEIIQISPRNLAGGLADKKNMYPGLRCCQY